MGRPSQCNPCCEEPEPPDETTEECEHCDSAVAVWRVKNPGVIQNGLCGNCATELNQDVLLYFVCGTLGEGCSWASNDKMACSGVGTTPRSKWLLFIRPSPIAVRLIYGSDTLWPTTCFPTDLSSLGCQSGVIFLIPFASFDCLGTNILTKTTFSAPPHCCNNLPMTITIEPA